MKSKEQMDGELLGSIINSGHPAVQKNKKMKNIEWDKVLFRASSWGNLMAEPQSKADKDAGKLGLSCQKELLKIYRKVKYDWDEDDITTPAMEKGTIVQPESIDMYSKLEGKFFQENKEELSNAWFNGTADLFLGESIRAATQVDDMKNSYTLSTFTDKMVETVTPAQKCQLNCYYSLSNAQGGNIVHALMSLPADMFQKECERLLWRMTNNGEVATEYSPLYIEAVEGLKKKFIYDHIPEAERIFIQPVPRDEELIEKMKSKVPILREWLYNFDKKHSNQYNKLVS